MNKLAQMSMNKNTAEEHLPQGSHNYKPWYDKLDSDRHQTQGHCNLPSSGLDTESEVQPEPMPTGGPVYVRHLQYLSASRTGGIKVIFCFQYVIEPGAM